MSASRNTSSRNTSPRYSAARNPDSLIKTRLIQGFWCLLLLLALGLWSAYWGLEDPGRVLIEQGQLRVESTAFLALWLFIIGALLSGMLLRFGLNLLTLPRVLRRLGQQRRHQQSTSALEAGLTDYLLQQGQSSIASLAHAAAKSDSPAAILLYVEVLCEQGHLDDALAQLEKAETALPHCWELPITRCLKLMEAGRFELAEPLLAEVRSEFPKAPMLALVEFHWALNQPDYHQAEPFLNQLKKRKTLPEQRIAQLSLQYYQRALTQILEDRGNCLIHGETELPIDSHKQQDLQKALVTWWKKLPKWVQSQSQLQSLYIETLIRLGLDDLAVKTAKPWAIQGHLNAFLHSLQGLPARESHYNQLLEWSNIQPSAAIEMLLAEQEMGLEQWQKAQQRLEKLRQNGHSLAATKLLFLYLKTGQPMAAKQLASAQNYVH